MVVINFDKDVEPRLQPLKDRMREINFLLIGLVFVLFIGFAGCFIAATTMLVDSFNSKATSYQELEVQVQTQNAKVEALTHELELQHTSSSTTP